MSKHDALAGHFESSRKRLRAVAYRMLGSVSEADDAVQEAWLRSSRSHTDEVTNVAGWLTTVVARICLDMLRARVARREEPLALQAADSVVHAPGSFDAEQDLMLADSVGSALLVVLETLSPPERLAFVLHDLFAVPFEEIAPILGRSVAAARQLASRARRRVQGQGARSVSAEAQAGRREIVEAFLAASREGRFETLISLLDPDVVLRTDGEAFPIGPHRMVSGSADVARMFLGRAHAAQLALIDGSVGAVWAPSGQTRVAFVIVIRRGRIKDISLIGNADSLQHLEVTLLTNTATPALP